MARGPERVVRPWLAIEESLEFQAARGITPAAIVGPPTAENDDETMRPIFLYVTPPDRSKRHKRKASGIAVVRRKAQGRTRGLGR